MQRKETTTGASLANTSIITEQFPALSTPMRFLPLAILLLFAAPLFGEPLVIQGGSLFNPTTGAMEAVQAIVIDGEKIIAVGTPQKPVTVPKGARVIDATATFIIPGLIDAHAHLVHRLNFAHVTGDEVLPFFLANGVTSVRDTGDEIVAQTVVARFAASHPETCPRVFTASHLIDADPPIHRDIGLGVNDPTKVPAIVAEMAAWKIATLKIYAGTGRPVGRRLIEEGHKHGLFVTGHLSAYRAQDAVEDGIDGIEHITSVFDFVFSPEAARQPDPRSTIDLSHPQVKGLIALLAKRKILVDPTLTVFKNMLLLSDTEAVQKHADNAPMPERLRASWDTYQRGMGLAPGTRDRRKKEFEKLQELTGLLHKAGVPLLAGTDAPEPYCPPGYSLHQELELLVQSGLTPAAALQAATINTARALKHVANIGSVEPGKLADLVILTADPTADIRNTRKIRWVVRGGHVCDPAKVLAGVK